MKYSPTGTSAPGYVVDMGGAFFAVVFTGRLLGMCVGKVLKTKDLATRDLARMLPRYTKRPLPTLGKLGWN